MLRIEDSLLAILAAGHARRFAAKLTQPLAGRPLGVHAAAALAALPFRARMAIVAPGSDLDYAALGFTPVVNHDATRDMASSVRLAAGTAQEAGAAALVIALADMPRVAPALVARLFDAADGPASVVAASDGARASPPALFGAARLADLMALTGDRGAAALIRAGRHVVAGPGELADVDTAADLAALTRGAARRSD